jgi:RnfABCDGE-type electron transport complex B subunit
MNPILIAFLVVTAVGLAAGILIALVSHFFGVEEDPRVKQIRECLPGINCGACGFKGCDDYAAALGRGNTAPNLCIPGGNDAAEQIGDIIGVKAQSIRHMVAFVHCNGHCEATTKKATYQGISNCKAAAGIYGGPDTCRFGCLGFGDCSLVCPAEAICMKDGIAHVDASLCLGCGMCTTVCPKHVISMVPEKANIAVMCNNGNKGADARAVCTNACIGCKKCEKFCPENAISVKNNLAVIDYTKCVGCGTCVEGCPVDAIKKVFFPALKPKQKGK